MLWPTYLTLQMHHIHDNIHLQYEISLGIKFSNLGHDLLLRVMT